MRPKTAGPGKTTLEHAVQGYWLDRRRNLSPNTIKDYDHIFARLVTFLGASTLIEAITTDDIRRFLNAMRTRRDLSAKTIINYQIALSSLWTWAAQELGIAHVVKHISRPRWNAPAIEPLTKAEVVAILSACARGVNTCASTTAGGHPFVRR